MKKLLIPTVICMLSLYFSACTTPDNRYETDDYLELNFLQPSTRADIAQDGSGTFSDGDKIGLYIDNGSEIQYTILTYSGGTWLPRLKRSDFGHGSLTISAHYPAMESASGSTPGNYPLQIPTDQTTENADLLFASTVMEAGHYSASLSFGHALHRIYITLSGNTENVQPVVRSKTSGSINLLSGETTLSESDFVWITPRLLNDGSYEAIILPQSAAPYRDGEGFIRLSSADKESVFMAPQEMSDGQPLDTFEAGKKVEITLNISHEEETPELANKILWVYGVHAPDFPGKENIPSYDTFVDEFPEGEWFRYKMTVSENQYLTWKEGCGWYDCNKSADYVENDGNLCWAASTSNHLLWWMEHNKAYIEAYDKEYGSSVQSTTEDMTYDRPAAEFLPLYYHGTTNRAPVFEFFKSSFRNIGSWTSAGVNWFINGDITNLQYPLISGFPGFFSEVFSHDDIISTDSKRHPNKATFNDFIIDALLNKKAIEFGVYNATGSGGGSHSMTIWGAEFDEQGYVSHVYYCDNNLSDQDANGAVISRKRIVYQTDDSAGMGMQEYTYLQSLTPEDGSKAGKFKIISLSATSLRQDIWAQKYPSVVTE